MNKPKEIPEGQSPVRFIMADKHSFNPLKGFGEAKAHPDGVAIFEGDYGGQIMMTIRLKYVQCPEDRLKQILADLNDICWNGCEGSGLYYERMKVGEGVGGGMGGGCIVDGVWAHDRLWDKGGVDPAKFGEAIGDILEKRSERLPEEIRKSEKGSWRNSQD